MNRVKFYVEDVAHRELVLVLTKVSGKQVRFKGMCKTKVLKALKEESKEHIVGVVDEALIKLNLRFSGILKNLRMMSVRTSAY